MNFYKCHNVPSPSATIKKKASIQIKTKWSQKDINHLNRSFHEIEEGGTLLKSFYEASIELIPKLDKGTTGERERKREERERKREVKRILHYREISLINRDKNSP
jgi:hypothetical protein